MGTTQFVDQLFKDFQESLTQEGRDSVFLHSSPKELVSAYIGTAQKPEEFTIDHLIVPILEKMGCSIDEREREFTTVQSHRRFADLTITTPCGKRYIVEAKPLNADLYAKKTDGAVNQAKDIMLLHEGVTEYGNAIATDGRRWIFVNNTANVVAEFDITEDFDVVNDIFFGNRVVVQNKEEITNRFYRWYLALMVGGTYSDGKGHTVKIPENESLTHSIDNQMGTLGQTAKEEIAQIYVNRLIFIKFLENKGVIQESVIDYLLSLSDDRLFTEMKVLFFNVLNTPEDRRDSLNPIFRKVPYLNGSLFIPSSPEQFHSTFRIKAATLKRVLNFLSTFDLESSRDGSVNTMDPEILGYIFEMSMNTDKRKESGSFYTPSQITSYMSTRTIHEVLLTRIREYMLADGYPSNDVDDIKTIDDVYALRDTTLRKIYDNVLLKLKICDNACGSGAFLLSSADVLFRIYFNFNLLAGLRKTDVQLKKDILSNNIFGVDLDGKAVEIAKLRMWLWVADSYLPSSYDSLPNIDYNVYHGDALIGSVNPNDEFKGTVLDNYPIRGMSAPVKDLVSQRDQLIKAFRNMSGPESHSLQKEINDLSMTLSVQLSVEMNYKLAQKGLSMSQMDFVGLYPFHWTISFNDVFEQGGFDIIIGNPPYVALQNIKDTKPYPVYQLAGYETFDRTGDLYCLFYERSLSLLRDGGMLAYITSNSWMKAKYGSKLRNFFIQKTEPQSIINLSKMKVFKSATVESGILIYKKTKDLTAVDEVSMESCEIHSESDDYDLWKLVSEQALMNTFAVNSLWAIQDADQAIVKDVIESNGVKLKNWGINIYRGITTGLDEVFVIDKTQMDAIVAKDPRSANLISPTLRGRDMDHYVHKNQLFWLINPHNGDKKKGLSRINVDEYPAIKDYLNPHIEALTKRYDKGDTPYNLRNCAFMDELHELKIGWIELADRGRFCLIEQEVEPIASVFFFAVENPYYLLGILNSSLVSWYFQFITATSGAGTRRWKKQYVENIPVPMSPSNKAIIEELVKQIMLNHGDEEIQKQIDLEVCKAYGLSETETQYLLSEMNQ
ncbi:MAG: class I SAM-dependent DNA methyltransferase [Thermoplasmata archaeon]|nr:class I SAM-dependent DNA methyltransferase [Thermoplasmata archaeon]